MIPLSVLRQPKAMLTASDIAPMFGCSRTRICNLVNSGYLPNPSIHAGAHLHSGPGLRLGRRRRGLWSVAQIVQCYLW